MTTATTMGRLTDRPKPGIRVAYRVDGSVRTGEVQPYEPGGGYTFPVRDDVGEIQRMLLPSECVAADEADFLRKERSR
jgi:hypothetical protein